MSEQEFESGANRRVRLALSWALGIACVVGAWVTTQIVPGDDQVAAPFVVELEMGERGDGRALAATVTGVVMAEEVLQRGWADTGNWLVAEVEAQALLQERATLLGHTVLVIDGRSYRASERVPDSLLRKQLLVGVPQQGVLAFELPEDVSGPARLELALNADTRLDSLLEFEIELDALPREAQWQLPATGWASA